MTTWLRQISIKAKISLAVIPLVLVLVSASVAGFLILINAVQQEKRIGAFAEDSFRTFSELGENFLLARVHLRDYLTFTEGADAELSAKTEQSFLRYAEQMQTSMTVMERKLHKAEQIGFQATDGIADLRRDFDAFVAVALDIYGHVQRKEFAAGKRDIGTVCHETAGAFLTSMAEMKSASSAFFTGVSNQVSTTLDILYIAAGVTLLVTLVGLFVLSRLVQGYVVKPLQTASARMHDIADGEGDLTQRLNDTGRDELAQLAQGFNKFVDKTQHLVQDITGSVGQLSTAASQLSTAAAQARGNLQRQHTETDQVASAINQMAATAQEVAHSTAEAATAANAAEHQATGGATVAGEAVNAISALHQQLEEAVAVIDTVASESQRIKTVLEVIREISEQTNLLALNAAIEAARAGDLGRGFAVVADEVRNLATRTQTSAGEIDQMIAHLTSQVDAAVQAMRAAGGQADYSEQRVASAAESLSAITSAVRALNTLNTKIATATEQQTAVTEEISRNVTNISQSVQETTRSAEQSSDASDGMARLASDLQRLVGRFRV